MADIHVDAQRAHEDPKQFALARALEMGITVLMDRKVRGSAYGPGHHEYAQAAEIIIGLRDLLCGKVTLPVGTDVCVVKQETLIILLREREDYIRQHEQDQFQIIALGGKPI